MFIASLPVAVKFLNEVFLVDDPMNTIYSIKNITMSEIQASVSPFTTLFDKKSPLSFAQWCGKAKVDLCKAESQKNILTEGLNKTQRARNLYVLNKEHHG